MDTIVEQRNGKAGRMEGLREPMKRSEAVLRIAPATEADVPEILAMIRGLDEYEHLTMTATEKEIRQSLFAWKPSAEALVAFLDEACAGYAFFYPTYSAMRGRRGLFLENLFTKPQWRGRGVGSALLKRLAKIAAERDCARLEWAVLDGNLPAIDFYQAHGAVLLHGWTKCRMSEDAIQCLCEGERI